MRKSSVGISLVISFALLPLVSARKPNEPPLPEARRERELALRRAEQDYQRAVIAADKTYVAKLDEAMKAATRAADLDNAVLLKEERKQVQGEIDSFAADPRGGAAKKLVVLSARFGNESHWADVTDAVARLVKGTDVEIPYRFDLVAQKDPLPNAQKVMVVVFGVGGQRLLASWQDNAPTAVHVSLIADKTR